MNEEPAEIPLKGTRRGASQKTDTLSALLLMYIKTYFWAVHWAAADITFG